MARNDTKVCVYMTAKELLALDHTILELRRLYGIKIDRSRYVREALKAASPRTVAEHVQEQELAEERREAANEGRRSA